MTGHHHAPVTLPLVKSCWYQFCGFQTRSGRFGGSKIISSLPGIEPRLLSGPSSSLVAVPSKYSGSYNAYIKI
jgi:hypothetical protein